MMSAIEYLDQRFPQFEPALKQMLAEHCVVKSLKAGERLMQTGQYFRSTMLIVEGRAKITHQEIANDLNTSREVISRLLKKMEQQKHLVLHRNYIEWLG